MTLDDLSVLDRRRIEAMVLGPLVRALQKEIGTERVNAIVGGVLAEIAREQGRAFRKRVGSADLRAFAENKGA